MNTPTLKQYECQQRRKAAALFAQCLSNADLKAGGVADIADFGLLVNSYNESGQ